MQDDRSTALAAFFSDIAAAAEAGDRGAYTEAFMPDAAVFLPHRPPLLGRDAIGDWFESFRSLLELHIDEYKQEKIDIVGDIALVRSHATGHYFSPKSGIRFPLDQKYLDVLRYVDGKWRLEYHVASSNSLGPGIWESDWESQ